MDIEVQLKKFIIKSFLGQKENKEISEDDSLLDSGLIDSSGVFELVGFIEKEFKIEISDGEITPDNFETISQLIAFINTKRQS